MQIISRCGMSQMFFPELKMEYAVFSYYNKYMKKMIDYEDT